MKYFLSSILLLIFLVSGCSGDKNTITMTGSFKHLQDGIFYVYSTDASWEGFDTVRVVDGEFSYSHPLEDTLILTMQYPNFMQMPIVAIPGGKVSIKGDAGNLLSIRISGSEENEKITEFRRSIIGKSQGETLREAEKFIRENPSTYAAIAIFQTYFVGVEKQDMAKISELMGLMISHAPERALLKILQARLQPYINGSKGKKLPSFRAVTIDGKTVSADTLRGSYALISFWSTLDISHLSLVEVYRKLLRPYKNNLKVVNISLDADTIDACRFIRKDTIPGFNICDRKSWQSPLVRALGVRFFPSNLLVSPQGVILERDMNEEELSAQLEKYLK